MMRLAGVALAAVFVAAQGSLATAQALRFDLAERYATREAQIAIATGDLNGDGRADVIVACFDGVSVLLNDGAGGFRAPDRHSTAQPGDLAVADFDEDGRLDAALTLGNDVAVFWGTGDGTLSGPTRFATGSASGDIVAADFNGDGRVDIATASFQTGEVSLHLSLGAGQFAAAQEYFVGSWPGGLAAGDVNHDGCADLAISHFYSTPGRLDLLLCNGANGFVPGPALPLLGGRTPTLADVNGDSHLDLLVPYLDGDTLGVLLGSGNGSFGPLSTLPIQTPARIAVGDLNEDGHADLAVAGFSGNSVSVLLGAGDGTFSPPATWGASTNPDGLALADFDGDQHLDVVVANGNANEISVLKGIGTGALHGAPLVRVGGWPVSMATARFDADERADLAEPAPFGIGLLFGKNDATFSNPPTVVDPNARWVAAGDFDGDGSQDIAAGRLAGYDVATILGDGHGAFGPPIGGPAFGSPGQGAVGDFNHDGLDDLVVLRADNNWIAVLLAIGGGQFGDATPYGTGTNPVAVAVGDINGDGILDLATADRSSNTVSVLPGLGGGAFAPGVRYGGLGVPLALTMADLNGDGRDDVIVSNGNAGTISVFLSLGRRLDHPRSYPAGSPWKLAARDVNGDGHPDVVVVDISGKRVLVFPGRGDGRLDPPLALPGPQDDVAIGDFDGDGRADIAAGNMGDVWLFRNITPMADLAVSIDDGRTSLPPGDGTVYSVEVTNHGPDAVDRARVKVHWPGALIGVSWTCTAPAGSSCPAAGSGGTGIDAKVHLAVGATATFVVVAQKIKGSASCIEVGASVSASNVGDPNRANNQGTDMDGVAPVVSVFADKVRGEGGGRPLRFIASLSRNSCREVTVGFATEDGTATAGQDYETTVGTLVVPAGATQAKIDVPILDDDLLEGNETVLLSLADATDATLATSQAVGIIRDDESAP